MKKFNYGSDVHPSGDQRVNVILKSGGTLQNVKAIDVKWSIVDQWGFADDDEPVTIQPKFAKKYPHPGKNIIPKGITSTSIVDVQFTDDTELIEQYASEFDWTKALSWQLHDYTADQTSDHIHPRPVVQVPEKKVYQFSKDFLTDSIPPASEELTVNDILNERGSRYGDFHDHSRCAQALQDEMRHHMNSQGVTGWERLSPVQKQALTVIADKIARILNGDPDYIDNWHDIQGYAALVEKDISKHYNPQLKR